MDNNFARERKLSSSTDSEEFADFFNVTWRRRKMPVHFPSHFKTYALFTPPSCLHFYCNSSFNTLLGRTTAPATLLKNNNNLSLKLSVPLTEKEHVCIYDFLKAKTQRIFPRFAKHISVHSHSTNWNAHRHVCFRT